MAEPGLATPLPDNNGCRMHKEYNFTCGTCNGLFDPITGEPTPPKAGTTPSTDQELLELYREYKYSKQSILLNKLQEYIETKIKEQLTAFLDSNLYDGATIAHNGKDYIINIDSFLTEAKTAIEALISQERNKAYELGHHDGFTAKNKELWQDNWRKG